MGQTFTWDGVVGTVVSGPVVGKASNLHKSIGEPRSRRACLWESD